MLSRIILPTFLLLFSSCALFKSQNIQHEKPETLISYLQGEGEGKGRLGINQHQYLFGFDALIKENNDWILAANIPLHGEEILLLRNLKSEKEEVSSEEGLEVRIERGISDYLRSQKQSPELAKTFLLELRRLMRVVLHRKLGLELICKESECRIGDVAYQVETSAKQITIKKSVSNDYEIELVGMNLTGPIFKRSNIFLHSKNKKSSSPALLSLELFWK